MQDWGNKRKIALAAVLAVCSALPFLQALKFPFLLAWDDAMLLNAEHLLAFRPQNIYYWLQGHYCDQIIPATFVSFMADYAVDGLNPMVFHAQNILWHAVACVGVFMCFTLFNVRLWLAFVLALAYAIHPQKAESVCWVLERKDVLFGAFAVWSFYFYAKTPQARHFAPLPLFLFSISLLSKPTAISFPAALLCFELTRGRPFNVKALTLRLAPFFALSAILASITIHHSDDITQSPVWMKLFISLRNLFWYVWSTLAPLDLLPIYPLVEFNYSTAIPVALECLCAVAAAAFLLQWKREFLLWKALPFLMAFAAAHASTIGLVQFNSMHYADRYNYIPSALLCFAIAWLLSRLLDKIQAKPESDPAKSTAAVALALGLWIAMLSWLSFSYCKTFSSNLALFSVATLPERPNTIAYCNLAVAKFKSNLPAGKELYERVLAERNQVSQTEWECKPDVALARILMATEAIHANPSEGKEPIKVLSRFASAKLPDRFFLSKLERLNILLECELLLRMKEESLATIQMMIDESKLAGIPTEKNPSELFYIGMKLFLQEDYKGAAEFFGKASRLHPESELFKKNLKSSIEFRDSNS